MTLQEIKVASYLMSTISREDNKYSHIESVNFDLRKKEHTGKLLKFLNDWGCRQFKKENHLECSKGLRKWFVQFESHLPSHKQILLEQNDVKIKGYKSLFDELRDVYASSQMQNGKDYRTMKVGPVGAAKILFAVRKNMFPPWDNPIIDYKEHEFNKDGDGYCEYLLVVKEKLLRLQKDCSKRGINIADVPSKILKRPHVSLVKLIDEYFWVSITRKCEPSKIISLIKQKP